MIYQFIPVGSSTDDNNRLYCWYQYVSPLAYVTNTLTFRASFNSSTGEIGDFELSLSDVRNLTFIPTDLKVSETNPSKLLLYNTEEPCYVGSGILTSSINGDPIIGDAPKNLNFAKNVDNELEKVTWGQEEFKVNAPYVVQQNDVVSVVDPTHSGSSSYTATVTFSERLGDIIKEGKREIIFPSNLANQILGTNYGIKIKFIPLSNTGPELDGNTVYQTIGYSSTVMHDVLVNSKEEFTIFFNFSDYYPEIPEVLPSKVSSNIGHVICETKMFIYNLLNMSFNVSIQNLRELYYNGMCSINTGENFDIPYGELRMKVTIGNKDQFAPDINFSPAGMDVGYLATSIIALSGTYYNHSGGQVIDQFTFPTQIQVYARLLRKTVNGTTSVFVEILRIDKQMYMLSFHNFVRYKSNGEIEPWWALSEGYIELSYSVQKMETLIERAQEALTVYFPREQYPDLIIPTTYLELIDCLNQLFDLSQGYASHSSSIIPLFLCQLIAGANTAVMMSLTDVLTLKQDIQVTAFLPFNIMELATWCHGTGKIEEDSLIEDATNQLFYTLSGTWHKV